MKKTLLCVLCTLFFVSCYNDKEFYSLQFKRNTVDEIAEKLEAFHALVEELPATRHYADYSGSLIVEIDSGRRGIFLKHQVYLNFREIGEWDSIKNHPDYLYSFPEFKEFSQIEKVQFWDLYQFLIANEINGAYNSENLIVFPFRQYPFANRHYMYIVLEDEYHLLSADERSLWLQNRLIIDKKDGLLLVIGDKARFLRYIYGSDRAVPEEWEKTTEKVFRVHAIE